jgi:hypothetical protein
VICHRSRGVLGGRPACHLAPEDCVGACFRRRHDLGPTRATGSEAAGTSAAVPRSSVPNCVDADQRPRAFPIEPNRRSEGRAHGAVWHVLDECQKYLRPGQRCPECREQMGLAKRQREPRQEIPHPSSSTAARAGEGTTTDWTNQPVLMARDAGTTLRRMIPVHGSGNRALPSRTGAGTFAVR